MAIPVTGIVEAIETREPRPGMMFVSLKVNGQRYESGKFAPRGIKQGDMVEFQYTAEQRGQYTNNNIVPRSVRKVEGSATPAQSTPAPAATSHPTPTKAPYVAFDERQDIISKQAALNTALEFCQFAAAQGAVEFTKTTKPAERLTLLRGWVLDEASKLYNLNTGRTWDIPEQAPAALPAERRTAAKKAAPETSEPDTGSNEFPDFKDDDIPF